MQSSTLILARAHGAGFTLASRTGERFEVSDYSPGTGDVYGWLIVTVSDVPGVDPYEKRGTYQKLPADLAEPMTSRADYMAPYPAGVSNEELRAIGGARWRSYYGAIVSPADLETVRRSIGMAALLASPDPLLNDIPLRRWDALANASRERHARTLKPRGDGWSLGNGVCILKAAALQLIEAERASAKGGEA